MRRFIVFFGVLIITLTFFSFNAFADDPEESDSSGDRLATQEELEQLDLDLHQTADLVYAALSDNGTKATTYTTTDIYNWLNNYLGTDFQNHGSTYPALMYARINSINTRLTSFNNLFSSWDTWINNISNNSTSIYLLLDELIDSINPDYQTVGISIYDLLHSISTALTSIDGDDGDLTLIETLVYMYNELEDMNTTLSNLLNSSYSVDNRLVTIYTYLTSFRSDMNTGFSNVNANMQLIISNIQNLRDDLNTINWQSLTTTFFGYYDADKNQYTSGDSISNTVYLNFSNFNTSQSYSYIYLFDIPFRPSNNVSRLTDYIKSIKVVQYQSNGSSFSREFDYYYYYDIARGVIHLYCTKLNLYTTTTSNTAFTSNTFSIQFELNYNGVYTFNNPTVSYITSNYADYFYIYDFIINRKNFITINSFRDLYASDDLIAAKQDQQAYEDQAIQDFTGSGSAAASGQDLGDMKSISGAIKSGLQTGGSVNNALAPFNTNSGFWGWFSQNNYDNINNIPSSGTRSGYNNQPEIIDFYTNNQYTLQGLLSGGGN